MNNLFTPHPIRPSCVRGPKGPSPPRATYVAWCRSSAVTERARVRRRDLGVEQQQVAPAAAALDHALDRQVRPVTRAAFGVVGWLAVCHRRPIGGNGSVVPGGEGEGVAVAVCAGVDGGVAVAHGRVCVTCYGSTTSTGYVARGQGTCRTVPLAIVQTHTEPSTMYRAMRPCMRRRDGLRLRVC
jgi:hypothetical protein